MSWQDEAASLKAVAANIRDRWRSLLAFGLVWRVASSSLLGPAYALVLRLAVATSGAPVLADTDLLYFATSPIGVLGLVAILTAGIVIVALELSVYLTIFAQPDGETSVVAAMEHVAARAPRVLRVTVRLVLHSLLWIAPAAIVAAVTYATLLSQFDINFYLAKRPPEFWIASVIAAVLLAYVSFAAYRLVTRWFFALPIALFEDTPLSETYLASQARCAGHQGISAGWVVAWAAASAALSVMTTALITSVGWLVGSYLPSSLAAVATGIGVLLLLLLIAGLAVNLLSVTTFAGLLWQLYLRFGGTPAEQRGTGAESRHRRWLTTGRVLAITVIGGLAAVLVGYAALASVAVEDNVVVIGHRGAPLVAPENSLPSVRAAIAARTDWVEIDVQETADGEVVVFHDSDFMKAAGVDLKVWDATADQLADIDIGSRFDASFANERVPTLAEVLAECRGKAGVVVELKYYGHDEQLEQRVAAIVESEGMINQTMFMSLNADQVARMKALRPEWKVGRLLSVALGNKQKMQADFLAINAKAASRSLIRSAHREGRQVYTWTVNDPVAMSCLIGRGVDGLITDVPDVARSVLRERVGMPPAVRLLIEIADRFRLAGEALALIGSPSDAGAP